MKLALISAALVGSLLCFFTGVGPFTSGGSQVSGDDVRTSYYPSGQVESRATLVEGLREGTASEWYANGQERCTGEYREGLREGAWVFFSSDGSLDAQRTGTYSKGVRTGP